MSRLKPVIRFTCAFIYSTIPLRRGRNPGEAILGTVLMKVLVIGNGGREHALVWKISQSPRLTSLFCAPGNAGTAELAQNVEIQVDDLNAIVAFARDAKIDLVIVGP